MDYLPLLVHDDLVELTKEGVRNKKGAIILSAPVLCGVVFFEIFPEYPINNEKTISEIYDFLIRTYRGNGWAVRRERDEDKPKRMRALIINREIVLSPQPGIRQKKNTPIRVEVDLSGYPVLRVNLWRL